MFIYDGTPKTPEVAVTDNGEELIADTDYSVSFSDNTEVGTATVTITGMGNFSGTKEVSFESKASDIDDNTCGEELTWSLSEDGTLTVNGTGTMYNYDFGGAPWSKYSDKIKKVVIENGAETVGDKAFSELNALTSVELPESLRSVGDYAFCNDENLSEITNISPDLKIIGSYAFENMAWLISMRDTDPLVIVNDVLIDGTSCTGEVKIPAGTKIISSYAFYGNADITSVNIPDGVRDIRQRAFENCTSLTKIVIPKTVNFIFSDAFNGCTKDLTIYGYEPSTAVVYAQGHNINFVRETYDLCTCIIILPQDSYVYEGKPIEPAVDVRIGDVTLERDKDYTVEFSDNDGIGTAVVTITGINDYSGVAEREFKIFGEVAEEIILGDINGVGSITVTDISKVAAHVKGKKSLSEDEQKYADANGDGSITVTDISKIAAHVKGVKALS